MIDLVSLVTWTHPTKSISVLLSMNFCYWMLLRNRPISVIAMVTLLIYMRHLWKYRIRSAILVNPPDSEDWVTLSSYQLYHSLMNLGQSLKSAWNRFHAQHPVLGLLVTIYLLIMLAKLGSHISCLALLALVSNSFFLLGPFLREFPDLEQNIIHSADAMQQWFSELDLRDYEQVVKDSTGDLSSSKVDFQSSNQELQNIQFEKVPPSEVLQLVKDTFPELTTASSSYQPAMTEELSKSVPATEASVIVYSPSPEVDSDEEFEFDSKYFESSSSSSSNSFEIIEYI